LGFAAIKKMFSGIKLRPNSIDAIGDIATTTIYPDCHTVLIGCLHDGCRQ
jgi:hypothetical protein